MSNRKSLPSPESYLTWRVPVVMDGEPRLLVPHSDPYEYEFPFDLLFDDEEHALRVLRDYGYEEEADEQGWVLCSSVCTPIRHAPEIEEE
jgi:hypothetical protein